jgi:hypothetical protein
MTSALLLLREGFEVTLFERAAILGGRAAYSEEYGEHCPRLMLPDYSATWDLLALIPGTGGGSIANSLTKVRRFEWSDSRGWIELGHLNRFLDRSLTAREQLDLLLSARRNRLIGETYGTNGNRYGRWRQYSLRTLVHMASSVRTASAAYAFPGSTQHYLVDPIVNRLAGLGVGLRTGTRVTRLARTNATDRVALSPSEHDAVIFAILPTDLATLLDASGIDHAIPTRLRHTHCKVITLDCDPEERVMQTNQPALYCREGFNILVQPAEARCVVLCTRVASTRTDDVVMSSRTFLDLERPIRAVKVSENDAPYEAVWTADPVRVTDMFDTHSMPNMQVAGSWVACGYPYDSAEAAVRSAVAAADGVIQWWRGAPDGPPTRAPR